MAAPYQKHWDVRYSHLVGAERPLHIWLGRNHIDFDVMSDADLDAIPEDLLEHRVKKK